MPASEGRARTAGEDHFQRYHRSWSLLGPPLRPDADVVAAFRELSAEHEAPMLLLGITPELAELSSDLTAVDSSQPMIDHVWPGDTPKRRARLGRWLKLELPPASFASVIGDGCLALPYPGASARLLREVATLLQPGGRFVSRVFASPDRPEKLADVRTALARGEIGNVHALKWRIAMALQRELAASAVTVRAIRAEFLACVPDRTALAARTGWPRAEIDTIDVYASSNASYSFPTRAELLAIVPPELTRARFVEAGAYPLAERCPLFVLERAR